MTKAELQQRLGECVGVKGIMVKRADGPWVIRGMIHLPFVLVEFDTKRQKATITSRGDWSTEYEVPLKNLLFRAKD